MVVGTENINAQPPLPEPDPGPRLNEHSIIAAPVLTEDPDADWAADMTVVLSNGITSYRLDEPERDGQTDHIPLVVCMHDMTNCSFMWRDLVHLLTNLRTGPPVRVLTFDFYGRGRSHYTAGMACTMDLFVEQLYELLQHTQLLTEPRVASIPKMNMPNEVSYPIILIGQGLGGSVSVGFAAKYPSLVKALVLLSPLGVQWNGGTFYDPWGMLGLPCIGERLWTATMQRRLIQIHEQYAFTPAAESATDYVYAHVVRREMAMLRWQLAYSPGYLQALQSTLQYFPLGNGQLVDLFAAAGRNPSRPVLVVHGEQDAVCDCSEAMAALQKCFALTGRFLQVPHAGRYTLIESFAVVAKEILQFCQEVKHEMRLDAKGY